MLGPMLYLTEPETQDSAKEKCAQGNADDKDAQRAKPESVQDHNMNWDLHATTKGGKGNGEGNGKGKGYGECWHCGEWGHPRRECPQLQGKDASKGSFSALKGHKGGGGKGKHKTGKGGKGYGYKREGNWNKGGGYHNYRPPGKGVGKGLNYMSEGWCSAWGPEVANNYYSDDWYGEYGDQHLG